MYCCKVWAFLLVTALLSIPLVLKCRCVQISVVYAEMFLYWWHIKIFISGLIMLTTHKKLIRKNLKWVSLSPWYISIYVWTYFNTHTLDFMLYRHMTAFMAIIFFIVSSALYWLHYRELEARSKGVEIFYTPPFHGRLMALTMRAFPSGTL
jgi:hypothetical protein